MLLDVKSYRKAAVEGQLERAAGLPAELAARYLPVDFIGAERPDAFALADVIISRSGAGTIAEVTALSTAAVFIPLASSAGDEQAHNARHLAEQGAAAALLGTDVTAADLQDGGAADGRGATPCPTSPARRAGRTPRIGSSTSFWRPRASTGLRAQCGEFECGAVAGLEHAVADS